LKRERIRQIVVGVVGLFYCALIYPLYTDLLHSSWLLVQKNETEPMFLSFYIALGFFLLLASRKPSAYGPLMLLLLGKASPMPPSWSSKLLKLGVMGLTGILLTW